MQFTRETGEEKKNYSYSTSQHKKDHDIDPRLELDQ